MSESRDKDPQTYELIGAAMEVHRDLGHGFLESVYQEAFAIELADRGIPFVKEAKLVIYYKGRALSQYYEADFICFDSVIVELKALSALSGREEAQVLNYLKATRLERGLLFNFGTPSLEFKRLVFSKKHAGGPTSDSFDPQSANSAKSVDK